MKKNITIKISDILKNLIKDHSNVFFGKKNRYHANEEILTNLKKIDGGIYRYEDNTFEDTELGKKQIPKKIVVMELYSKYIPDELRLGDFLEALHKDDSIYLFSGERGCSRSLDMKKTIQMSALENKEPLIELGVRILYNFLKARVSIKTFENIYFFGDKDLFIPNYTKKEVGLYKQREFNVVNYYKSGKDLVPKREMDKMFEILKMFISGETDVDSNNYFNKFKKRKLSSSHLHSMIKQNNLKVVDAKKVKKVYTNGEMSCYFHLNDMLRKKIVKIDNKYLIESYDTRGIIQASFCVSELKNPKIMLNSFHNAKSFVSFGNHIFTKIYNESGDEKRHFLRFYRGGNISYSTQTILNILRVYNNKTDFVFSDEIELRFINIIADLGKSPETISTELRSLGFEHGVMDTHNLDMLEIMCSK